MPFQKPHQTSDKNGITGASIRFKNGITGNKTSKYEITPKGLNIVWGSDPRYWTINDNVAELKQVSWLEVSGKVDVEKGARYKVNFEVEVKEDGFGWNGTEVLVMAKIGKRGGYKYKIVTLTPGSGHLSIPNDQLVVPVDQNEKDPELHFGLYEVWSGKWKGGLLIKKAEIIKQ